MSDMKEAPYNLLKCESVMTVPKNEIQKNIIQALQTAKKYIKVNNQSYR